jgi:hypothetical protein
MLVKMQSDMERIEVHDTIDSSVESSDKPSMSNSLQAGYSYGDIAIKSPRLSMKPGFLKQEPDEEIEIV